MSGSRTKALRRGVDAEPAAAVTLNAIRVNGDRSMSDAEHKDQTPPSGDAKTNGRRERILAAARKLFAERGFSQTNVADITALADVSIGSVYYHFANKNEIFFELWSTYSRGQSAATRAAVAAFRAVGVTDGSQLFLAGTRAYLLCAYDSRDLVSLFYGSDQPADFSERQRIVTPEFDWHAQNQKLLQDKALTTVLTGSMGEVSRQVAALPTKEEAETFINAVIAIFSRLMTPQPEKGKT